MLETTITDHVTDEVHPCVICIGSPRVFRARVTNTRLTHLVLLVDFMEESRGHITLFLSTCVHRRADSHVR
jgi:hypothetical protein